ncbi:MAG: FKBP-type peptidyl-prolyl cis-trans isomerase [Reichenbachiella sp.]|uniref:FKBP-type peptidyl-prolyl cis-trans isomerase n=1 Tax=Reichenbachiella sp. TaxID=2184521 RepID=UPI00326698C1
MRMNIVKNSFLVIVFLAVGIVSCVDHAADNEAEIEQARIDSLAQAEIEVELFDDYIADADNGINEDDVVEGDFGVRHVVWNPITSVRTPEYNELVSVHYAGQFLTNEIFDTTNPSWAQDSDSLNYVEEGISFDDLLEASSKSYLELLDSLNSSDGAILNPLYDADRLYVPIVFNHTEDGSGIGNTFIIGFRIGLRDAMIKMELNSEALIMIPSAVAYGTFGTFNSDGTESIPPDTPLIFKFSLVNIRP